MQPGNGGSVDRFPFFVSTTILHHPTTLTLLSENHDGDTLNANMSVHTPESLTQQTSKDANPAKLTCIRLSCVTHCQLANRGCHLVGFSNLDTVVAHETD